MPHQCVHCGKLIEDASQELLKGCGSCGSHFFFYIRKDQVDNLKENKVELLNKEDKEQIEKDVREIIGVEEEKPVVLDLESVKVIEPGKFIIDVVSLFRKEKPLIYKLEEGKYVIDIASTLQKFKDKKK